LVGDCSSFPACGFALSEALNEREAASGRREKVL